MSGDSGRRPLASRNLSIFNQLARLLNRWGVTPNAISVASVVFSALVFAALLQTHDRSGWHANLCWLAAALGIQMRLLCNLLDGMVAIECRQRTPMGDLFNEVPDRVADVLILIGLGYSKGASLNLAFWVALMALFLPYLRALGASLVNVQAFHGPMAKPHRMFVATLVCLLQGLLPDSWLVEVSRGIGSLTNVGLWVILVGSVVTAIRRLGIIGKKLNR